MELIKLSQQVRLDIDQWTKEALNDGPRSHLGASEIGHPCSRLLWYKFRWYFFEQFSGRMRRLFDRGKREEHVIYRWLRGIGAALYTTQTKYSWHENHFGGSSDGVLELPEERYGKLGKMLLEIKTKGTGSGFNQLLIDGVQRTTPMHWHQMNVYGVGEQVDKALYIVVNKNDDDLHTELVQLNPVVGQDNIHKALRVIQADVPPPKFSNIPSNMVCKYCPALDVCHLGKEPLHNCRSCASAKPSYKGTWYCLAYNAVLPEEVIKVGCPSWKKEL
jgi:hypothetical protein